MKFKYELSEDYKNGIWLVWTEGNKIKSILLHTQVISEDCLKGLIDFLNSCVETKE